MRNDKGEVIKRTTKTRVIKIEKKVYKVGGTCGRVKGRAGPASVQACSGLYTW